jgi:hypothetical protein
MAGTALKIEKLEIEDWKLTIGANGRERPAQFAISNLQSSISNAVSPSPDPSR